MLNDYDRYAISGNSEDLIYEDDGSLRILIGGKPPEGMVGVIDALLGDELPAFSLVKASGHAFTMPSHIESVWSNAPRKP